MKSLNITALPSTQDHSSDAEAGLNLQTGLVHLPPTFLDAIIPGYSVLAKFFLSSFGIDISFYVSLVALAFATWTALRITLDPIFRFLVSYSFSTVVIDEYDSIWDDLLRFCSSHPALQNLRSLRGRSQDHFFDDDSGEDDSDNDADISMQRDLPDDAIFNYKNWAARAPPQFEPHSTSGFFWHKGHLFKISREAERVTSDWNSSVRDREKLYISVAWRSAKPIKDLIEEARELSLSKRSCKTTIQRPTPKSERGRRNAWQTVSKRPSRSMATVVLDNEQKIRILEDINEFLHPKTARWYSNRGIPYRRGYLFYGAPGTGKSSLSFSLAGVFGLDIYCLSLSEVTLTEEDMMMLFNSLPKRCIVLLEDIDCAGISRPKPVKKQRTKKKSRKARDTSATSTGEEVPAIGPRSKRLTNAITISGLLNAVDGISTAEGRVLIMTTNYPEKLDDALVRPGRVDMRIEFKLSGREQIRELFLRMYCADDNKALRQPTKLAQVLPLLQGGHYGSGDKLSQDVIVSKESGQSIEALADEFADSLPPEKFSPAEIQGFLLTRKRNPHQAAEEVRTWSNEQLQKKLAVTEKQRFRDVGGENEGAVYGSNSTVSSSDSEDIIDESEIED